MASSSNKITHPRMPVDWLKIKNRDATDRIDCLAHGTPDTDQPTLLITRIMDNGHTEETNTVEVDPATGGVVMSFSYASDFPTLPEAAPATAPTAKQTNVWHRSNLSKADVTITFRLASDERSNKVKSFGNTSEESKKAQQIASQTKTRIELSESKDGELTVVVKGERAKAEEARARIVRDLQTQASRELDIPKEHHGRLIGKEGALLRSLEADTNCRIQIPARDGPSSIITITGPREGIQRAAAHILAVSEREAKLATEHIVCPKNLVPFVRGPFNETYDSLTLEHGVKINIPPSHVANEVISVTGEKEGVFRAAAEIRKIVESKKNPSTIQVQVARTQHRYIIGQGRSGIHEILRNARVVVEVPSEESGSDQITLIGDAQDLAGALQLVIERASSVVTQSIAAPNWLHKHLIGPKGSTLSALVPNREKVQIEFDDSNHIFIEGAPVEVKAAHEILAKEVARLQIELAIEKVKVHPSLHRHVIGRGGSLISKIKEQTGVQVTIPNEETNSDEIVVEGKKDGVKKAVAEIRAIVTKIENEKSRDIIIPQRLHKLIIGSKGSGVQAIRDSYPNVSIGFPDAKSKSDVVNIRGDKAEVDAVFKKLTTLSKEYAENNYQETVAIFKEFLKHIVGKGGASIRKLRDETETRIDLPEAGSDDGKITVTGKQANVEKAVAQLNKIQEELANVAEETIEIPTKVQARFFGNGRRLIADIEEECGGVHIRFPSEKSESTKVSIRGPAGDVTKAVALLSALAKDKEENYVEDTVKAKPEFHRFLIGKGGSKIAKLRDTLNVRIMFPKEGEAEKEIIHLLGKKDDVPKAKAALEEAIKQLSETTDIKIQVDPKYYKNFLAHGATVVKMIQEQNGGVVISFPKNGSDSDEVSIRGSKQCVEAAKARIEDIVDDYEKQITSTVAIPTQFHRGLLAGRGAKIHELQSKFNVSIRFPNNREEGAEGSDQVSVSGRDTKVEEAKEALLALVPISKVIQLPIDMHRSIIGRGGETVRKLMQDYDVNISIPKDNSSEDITVTGQVANVDQALEALREKLVEYEALAEDRKLKQWSMTINVPTDYHQKIIGQRGQTITALKEKFGVIINVPREEGNEAITIQGYEEKANACAAEIENMISELRSMFTQEISLDARYHPRLIGQRGRNLKKVMEDFRVEIRLPRQGAEDPNLVIVAGKDENDVYDCIDFLRGEEEEFLLDNVERTQYLSPRHQETNNSRQHQAPVTVQMKGAPWQLDIGSSEQFPDMGAESGASATAVGGAWGSSRRW
uniref:K Homology domain-containing protein n=1 Tax=Caenorhabditis japonica TaxID=281687 RepID=A0A8R1DZS3_CAEJA